MTSPAKLISSFTEDDVAHWLGARTLAKAPPYVDAIDQIEIDDRRIAAWVKGSQRAPYRVRVEFIANPRHGYMPITPSCTCPIGFGCKHVAATLLAAIRSREGSENIVRPQVEQWLAGLQGLVAPETPAKGGRQGKSPTKKPGLALFYLLTPASAGKDWEVRYLKASQTPTGGMAKAGEAWTNFETALNKRPSFVSDDDEEILQLLWSQRGRAFDRYWATGLPLSGRNFSRVMPKILATGRAFLATAAGALSSLREGAPRTATLTWSHEGRGVLPRFVGEPAFANLIPASPPWYVDSARGEAGPLETGLDAALVGHLLALPALGEAEAQLVSGAFRQLAPALPRPVELAELPLIDAPLTGLLVIEHTFDVDDLPADWTEDHEDYITVAFPAFRYGDLILPIEHQGEFFTPPDGKTVRVRRHPAREKALLAQLTSIGMISFGRGSYPAKCRLPGKSVYCFEYPDDWLDFETGTLPELTEAGWEVRLPEVFAYRTHRPDAWFAELEESNNGFALAMGVEVEGQRIPLAPLIHVMLRNEPRWFDATQRAAIADDQPVIFNVAGVGRVALPAGRLRPLVEVLVDLLDRPGTADLQLSRLDAARLAEATAGDDWRLRGMDSAQALHERLKASSGVTAVAPPAGFNATLRPYQETGLAWLQFLREHGLGGILADDMGLGKTAQTLAHLLTEKQAGRLGPLAAGGARPALIVLPTSLVYNWKREAAHFAPQLTVLSLHGNDRKERFGAIAEHDVVLTTYPLLWRDAETLKTRHYHTLILDEAQTVKNAASRAAETVRELKADHRLCLTGTPLENHLGELWAQFDFLLPGFLGDVKSFTRDWRTPIEKRGDALRRDLLARRLRPFILRRKKEEVAKELPAKSVIVRTVELEGTQRDLYEMVRSTMDKKVRDEIAKKGFARSQIVILDALLKLRQTCCDPRLLKSEATRKVKERAKLDLLMNMLPELVDEGRRILVFSQFAEMLDLIEAELATAKLPCVRLSGQTKDRETPIRRFQNGEVPIFLISLKAGGVGLNLTAADTVIHYDPWWNPAAENQATDRAHRIGQTKQVFVYKLIVAGSIEEKILGLQEKKAALAEGILSEKGDALAKFSPDDISSLLAPLA